MFSQLFKAMGLAKTWPGYTMEEVKEHNSPASLWIVAGNSVYDVTSLLGKHVGGDAAILKRGGGAKDCTQDFLYHDRATRRQTEEYKIGELIPSPASGAAARKPQQNASTTLPTVKAPSDAPAGETEKNTEGSAASRCVPSQSSVTLSPSLSSENLPNTSWHASGPCCSSVCDSSNASGNGISVVDSPLESHSHSSVHQFVEVSL